MESDERIELLGNHATLDLLLVPHAERDSILRAYLAPLSVVDAYRLTSAVLSNALGFIDAVTKDDPSLLQLELAFAKSSLPPI